MAAQVTPRDMLYITPFWIVMVVIMDLNLLRPPVERYWRFQWHEPVAASCMVVDRSMEPLVGKQPVETDPFVRAMVDRSPDVKNAIRYRLTFRYTADGTPYTATDVVSKRFHDAHPPGSQTQCYFSPVAPDKALLEEHWRQRGAIPWAIFLVLVPFHAGAVFFGIQWPSLVRTTLRRRFQESRS